MSSSIRAFTKSVRDGRYLSTHLVGKRRVLDVAIRELRTMDDLEDFIRMRLPELLAAARSIPPELGGGRAASVWPPGWTRDAEGVGVMAARHWVAFEVRGEAETLTWWPDEAPTLLAADEPPSATAKLAIDNANDAWEVRYDGATQMLYTSVFMTADEEQSLDISTLIRERRDRIEPIVHAIADQVRRSNNELDSRVEAILELKRIEFENREGVSKALKLPYEWFAEMPLLELPDAASDEDPAGGGEAETVDPLSTPASARLDAKSFEQIQSIVRLWADSAERYPRSFSMLTEDQLSDLLAATLNAATSGAGREVYTHAGKSDIFVRADVLREGYGPAKILIIESKWANSKKVVQNALDPQLFSYLTVRDTSAVLLVLVREKHFKEKRERVLSWLRAVSGFATETESAVADWPIFVYENEGRDVTVCVATVHLDGSFSASDIVVSPSGGNS